MRNNNLIFANIWNSCANGNGRGCPEYIRDDLRKVLEKSRSNDLFNEQRLNPEDDAALSELCRDLDTMVDQLNHIENEISRIALKYRERK